MADGGVAQPVWCEVVRLGRVVGEVRFAVPEGAEPTGVPSVLSLHPASTTVSATAPAPMHAAARVALPCHEFEATGWSQVGRGHLARVPSAEEDARRRRSARNGSPVSFLCWEIRVQHL